MAEYKVGEIICADDPIEINAAVAMYTASAPLFTAAIRCGLPPTGASSSGFLYFLSIVNTSIPVCSAKHLSCGYISARSGSAARSMLPMFSASSAFR